MEIEKQKRLKKLDLLVNHLAKVQNEIVEARIDDPEDWNEYSKHFNQRKEIIQKKL